MKHNQGFSVTSLCYLKCAFELEYRCVMNDKIDSPGSCSLLRNLLKKRRLTITATTRGPWTSRKWNCCLPRWSWYNLRLTYLEVSTTALLIFSVPGKHNRTCVSSNLPLTSNLPNKSKSFPALWKSKKRLSTLRVNSSVFIPCEPTAKAQLWEHYSCRCWHSRWSKVGGPSWPSCAPLWVLQRGQRERHMIQPNAATKNGSQQTDGRQPEGCFCK